MIDWPLSAMNRVIREPSVGSPPPKRKHPEISPHPRGLYYAPQSQEQSTEALLLPSPESWHCLFQSQMPRDERQQNSSCLNVDFVLPKIAPFHSRERSPAILCSSRRPVLSTLETLPETSDLSCM